MIKAINQDIIIEIEKDEFVKNQSGIILHETTNLPTEGTIVSIGNKYKGVLSVGDKVKFRQQPGDLFDYKNKRYYRTTESKIYYKI